MDMKSPIPKISIIIPTYNQAALLEKALQSVTAQTFQDWEAIVIDNHSTDRTKDVVDAMQDSRIRYMTFSNHGIIAASRNLGIRMAAGSVIAFLDSDDLWYPSKLSSGLGCMDRGADAICHGLRIRKDGVLEGVINPKPGILDVFKILLFQGNSGLATSAVMVKKECFDRLGVFSENPLMVTAEDYELWLRFSKHLVRWGFLAEVYGEYTVHGKNASGNIEKQMLAEDRIVITYFSAWKNPPLRELLSYRKRRMMIVFRAGIRIWQSGNRCASLPYLLKGISRLFG